MFFSRIKWSAVINQTRFIGKTLFSSRFLLITNVTISTSLSGIGDALQQQYEIWTGEEKMWNKKRTRDMMLTGTTVGVICHFWVIH